MIPAAAFVLISLQSQNLKRLAERDHLQIDEIRHPLTWQGDGYVVAERPASAAQLAAYERIFVKEWSRYPASFIVKSAVHRIVIGVHLSMNDQLRASVPAFDGDTMYYDAALGARSAHYQRIVIHHEFFHLVDDRMKVIYHDPEWEKLNPPGFKYGQGGAKMRRSGVGELTDTIPGFLTRYGTSAVEEDKAELFAHMIVDGPYVRQREGADPILAAKIGLLEKRLAAFDPNMGPKFWKKIPGWSDLRRTS
ncbi:MAG TPA: hypothetical protein VMI31_13075 [Fimbriimonadaceae bacterium]|nr:hypothetical protein [Fimbriimonadaceae bacterium]